ncbi:hypothetical protein [Methanosphaerula subterraneus]|uniref:hypothetical protein n=1 Tax=Methanosphaerula subterraneus TaxID=3350244 RepID=UPI003F84F6FF
MTNIKIICDRNIPEIPESDLKNLENDLKNLEKTDPHLTESEKETIKDSKMKVLYHQYQKGRTCFWRKIKKSYTKTDLNFDFISIADTLSKYFKEDATLVETSTKFTPFLPTELFSREKTDIIIINWDAINNDSIYGSDKAFQFFNNYKSALNEWVKIGGILILESQSVAWNLVQDSYNIFDQSIVTSTRQGKDLKGITGLVNEELAEFYPILCGIKDKNIELINKIQDDHWFPKVVPDELSVHPFIQACDHKEDRKRLYMSWFESCSDQWDPIIFTGGDYPHHDRKPIMLCKIVETPPTKVSDSHYGAYILTTMYLGSSGNKKLIENLLTLNEDKLGKYYKKREMDNQINEARILKEQEDARILKEQEDARILKEQEDARILKEQEDARILKEQEDARILKERELQMLKIATKRRNNIYFWSGFFLLIVIIIIVFYELYGKINDGILAALITISATIMVAIADRKRKEG